VAIGALLVLFVSYVFGNIVRSLPVDWAELPRRLICVVLGFACALLTRRLEKWRAARGARSSRSKMGFPYPDVLIQQESNLAKHFKAAGGAGLMLGLPTRGQRHEWLDVFYYWKNYIATWSPEALSYYESYEARTRFAATMLWSGLVGAALSVFRVTDPPNAWLFCISSVLVFAFGSNLRRLREHEAKTLVALFVAMHHEPLGPKRARHHEDIRGLQQGDRSGSGGRARRHVRIAPFLFR